jgi:hypothetical protein
LRLGKFEQLARGCRYSIWRARRGRDRQSAGSAGGRMFGLELEGLSPEDQEFEVARRVVK